MKKLGMFVLSLSIASALPLLAAPEEGARVTSPRAELPAQAAPGASGERAVSSHGRPRRERIPEAAGLLAHFKDAELVKIAGAGHWLHHERPDEVLALLRRLLETARPSQPSPPIENRT